MSGVIAVPDRDPWFASGWAFRLILERAKSATTNVEDIYALEQAIALNGLHFKHLSVQQVARLASVLLKAVTDLVPELAQSQDQRDHALAKSLPALAEHLRAVLANPV